MIAKLNFGEVSEWPKEHAWKACVGVTPPRVRIPPSPPSEFWCEPVMELGPCASSSFEPCQTRKGAALRGNTTSAAGRLGSMASSFLPRPRPNSELTYHRPESLQNNLRCPNRSIRLIWFPARNLEELIRRSKPGTTPQLTLSNLSRNHVFLNPLCEDR